MAFCKFRLFAGRFGITGHLWLFAAGRFGVTGRLWLFAADSFGVTGH
ncbi:MAG: hypothetical protein LBQ31_03120 [Bacteroidales bacterium]|nr:hypothetical protein [Bacteroidales bacterium]